MWTVKILATERMCVHRIPKEDVDEIVHYEHTDNEVNAMSKSLWGIVWYMYYRISFFVVPQHIVVICGGNYYIVPVVDSKGKTISPLDLESQFDWIKADVKHSQSE